MVESEVLEVSACPLNYRIPADALNGPPASQTHVLYVVGGLYGNRFALDAIEMFATAETEPVEIVVNGDAHWLNARTDDVGALDRRLARYPAIKGNVEAELARGAGSAGCGCSYPFDTDPGVIKRSDAIMATLQCAAESLPGVRARCGALPQTLVVAVGAARVGIVHGDTTSISGWAFARESLDAPGQRASLREMLSVCNVDILTSTHTGRPAMRKLRTGSRARLLANNGAAGIGHFPGEPCGIITRIATYPAPFASLYGAVVDGVYAEAVAVRFERERVLTWFDSIWPSGSPAAIDYRPRLVGEARDEILMATPRTLF